MQAETVRPPIDRWVLRRAPRLVSPLPAAPWGPTPHPHPSHTHTHTTPAPPRPADFEKGFIRAETVGYEDYVATGGWGGAKESGKLRLEGKEYVVKEGDVMLFRFNV